MEAVIRQRRGRTLLSKDTEFCEEGGPVSVELREGCGTTI